MFGEFKKVTEYVDRLLIWTGFFTLLSAGLTYTASNVNFLKPYGLSGAIFVGLGTTAVIILVVSLALFAWRYFKPIPSDPISDALHAQIASLETAIGEVATRTDVLEQASAPVAASLDDLSNSMTSLGSRLDEAEANGAKHADVLTTALGIAARISPAAILSAIADEMDRLATLAYGGSNPPPINPEFAADPDASNQFQTLDQIACAVVRNANLQINIPSDAGQFWWIPPVINGPAWPDERLMGNPLMQTAMRLRCDHYRIKEYLRGDPPANTDDR